MVGCWLFWASTCSRAACASSAPAHVPTRWQTNMAMIELIRMLSGEFPAARPATVATENAARAKQAAMIRLSRSTDRRTPSNFHARSRAGHRQTSPATLVGAGRSAVIRDRTRILCHTWTDCRLSGPEPTLERGQHAPAHGLRRSLFGEVQESRQLARGLRDRDRRGRRRHRDQQRLARPDRTRHLRI